MPVLSDEIQFSKYKRAFTFGCSFTSYYWPTWADLISYEIPETYQYGHCGAGNFYIYQSLIEAILTKNIGPNDLVMVMFSNVIREDRYTKKEGWITPGNLFHQDTYDEKFLNRFLCEKGYLMRDCTLIEGVDRILSTTKADYSLMSMINLDSYSSDQHKMSDVDDVLNLYASTIQKLKPSVFEVIFNNDWNSIPKRPIYKTHWSNILYTDNHPTVLEHLEYLLKVFPKTKFSENTYNKANECNDKLFFCKEYNTIISTFESYKVKEEKRL